MRAAILAIVSVLLDAGAGPQWRYEEDGPERPTRSEGLAVASFDMFIGGVFSSRPEDPYRVDAGALMALTARELAAGQVSHDNPLVGVENRAALLNRLGREVATALDIFGQEDDPRPGGLFDAIVATAAANGAVRAAAILEAILDHLGAIWPGRIVLGGVDLGDTWRHPLAQAPDATRPRAVPQALAMALLLAHRAARMGRLHGGGRGRLTGLPEYRNGGLFLDTGVIARKDPAIRNGACGRSALVVEWRALTVALLDRIAVPIRSKLGLAARTSPREGAGRRHLGDRAAAREGAARGRLAAAPGHQRRDGFSGS